MSEMKNKVHNFVTISTLVHKNIKNVPYSESYIKSRNRISRDLEEDTSFSGKAGPTSQLLIELRK